MSRHIEATITVAGDDAALREFRTRANALLDADREVPYRELHTAGQLEYRIKGSGVPYPPFVTASADFPELTVAVRWENAASGESGRATINGGRLTDQTSATAASACELRVDADGALVLALTCRRRGDAWIGYVATATQHAFFRLRRDIDGEVLEASDGIEPQWAERWTLAGEHATYARVEPRAAIDAALLDELDRLANAFADEWLWFDESPPEETAVERARYAAYGYTVHPANVRSGKLKGALQRAPEGGFVLEMADATGRAVAAMISRHWLAQTRH
jgi:hypothetical protein